MWALVIVKGYPVCDHPACVLDAAEALAVSALLLERADNAFHHFQYRSDIAPKFYPALSSFPALVLP